MARPILIVRFPDIHNLSKEQKNDFMRALKEDTNDEYHLFCMGGCDEYGKSLDKIEFEVHGVPNASLTNGGTSINGKDLISKIERFGSKDRPI